MTVTTLSPSWFCSGLVRHVRVGHLVIGQTQTFTGGHSWLAEHGVNVVVLDDERCRDLMSRFIVERPKVCFEDIGEPVHS